MVGNEKEATQCLLTLVEVAKAAGQTQDAAQAEATENLGILAATRRDLVAAAGHLEKAYSLKKTLFERGDCSRADLQRARVLVGLAKAQGLSAGFFKAVVTSELTTLIPWKDGKLGTL